MVRLSEDATHIAAECRRGEVGDAKRFKLALEVGLALGEKFDAGGVEQHGDRRHEHHGQDVAAQGRDEVPTKHAQIAKIPGLGQPHRGRSMEHPAAEARILEGEPRQGEAEMSDKRSCDQDAG